MSHTAEVVICGAGITGVAAADFLARSGMKNILLVDERPPLSFTTTGPRNVIVTGGQTRKCSPC